MPAGYLETLLDAQRLAGVSPDGSGCLRDVVIERNLIIADDRPFQLDIRLSYGLNAAEVWSVSDNEPRHVTRHAVAHLHPLQEMPTHRCEVFDYWKRMPESVNADQLYSELERHSIAHAAMFRPITDLRRNRIAGWALARLELPKEAPGSTEGYVAHPILLDGCFQALLSLIGSDLVLDLPTSIGSFEVHRPLPRNLWCLGKLRRRDERAIECDLWMVDACGENLARVIGLTCKAPTVGHPKIERAAGPYHHCVNDRAK
jgi:hypothetical protein